MDNKLGNYIKQVNKLNIKYNTAKETKLREEELLLEAKENLKAGEEAFTIVKEVAKFIQTNSQEELSSTVTRCLEAIMDEPYEFKILFEEKRGKPEARLVFFREGLELDPTTESGLGIVDIASFALRLSCLVLSRPKKRSVLIMDEPFRFVSDTNIRRVKNLLTSLSKELQVQFILVTHEKELKVGHVIQI